MPIGDITINTTNAINIDESLISNQVAPGAVGDAGGININTKFLNLTGGSQVSASTFGQGNAGSVNINTENRLSLNGENFDGIPSSISSIVLPGAMGNGGNITITTNSLSLIDGGQVFAVTGDRGKAGNISVEANESIFISGVTERNFSGLSASALVGDGDGGSIDISTNQLTITNGGAIETSNFDRLGILTSGTGEPGNINIQARSLSLSNQARIDSATQSKTGDTANINLQLSEDLILRENSFISASASEEANGGNLNIDARFLIAYPSKDNGSDILASAEQGQGGNIDIDAEALLNIKERKAFDNNGSNDIDASSEIEGLDGTVSIQTPDKNPLRETTELDREIVQPKVVTRDTCSVDNSGEASGLVVKGKGGVPPEPFNGEAIITEDDATTTENPVGAIHATRSESFRESPLPDENAGNFDPNHIPPHIKPVTHDENGEPIYIARGRCCIKKVAKGKNCKVVD